MNPELDPIPTTSIPGSAILEDYDWLDDFFSAEKLKQNIMYLRQNLREYRDLPPTKEDFKNRLKKSFDAYQDRRRNQIKNYLLRVENSNDPFGRFESNLVIRDHLGPSIAWDEIETALDDLERDDQSAISDQDRQEELAAIRRLIAEDQSELSAVSDQKFFPFVNGSVKGDIRIEFVRHWESIQSRCNAPCGPRGLSLNASPEDEKKAYERLGIAKFINFSALVTPAQPTKIL